ncbi:hypothetical protein CL615_03695 [archaeon]|jgi:hypothetical protein|nr:hypothetical protein [archaeon]MDP6547919.1 hypothetical protein [Candidatus Woesearchaeota archaeon]|tara:strand:+ start:125188 stop:126294 length:1107 start_codon:yes stop_codon:yes gene_type:complete
MKNVTSFVDAYPTLRAIYGKDFDEYAGNFGKDAFVLKQTDKPIPRKSVKVNIAASAGDLGNIKESLGQFENKSRYFGERLAENLKYFSKTESIDSVVTTGGCPNIGDWATQEIREYNPNAFLVALSPKFNGEGINPKNLPLFLDQYDLIVYTDMNLVLRSALVGQLTDILFCLHGGYGTSMEMSVAAHSKKVVSFFDMNSKFGVSKFGAKYLRNISYQDTGAVFFKNSDADNLVVRALTEHKVNEEGIRDNLTSVVLYKRVNSNDNKFFLVNIRDAGNPATFYHRGNKKIFPLCQTLITAPREKVLESFKSLADDQSLEILETRKMEEPFVIKMSSEYDAEKSMELTEILRNEIVNKDVGNIFWNRSF